MGIVGFSLKRRVTISMCAVAVMLFGGVAFTRLQINLLPDLSYPSLTVETKLPGAAPAEVEALVTRPIEEFVSALAARFGGEQAAVARRAVQVPLFQGIGRAVLRTHRIVRAQPPELECSLDVAPDVLADVD